MSVLPEDRDPILVTSLSIVPGSGTEHTSRDSLWMNKQQQHVEVKSMDSAPPLRGFISHFFCLLPTSETGLERFQSHKVLWSAE